MASPDLLAIGHVARDVTPRGDRVGGTVVFGAVTAARLGLRPAIVTSASPGLDLGPPLSGIPVHTVPSDQTTTFKNIYRGGERTQFVEGVAGPIALSDVPPAWQRAPMVLLGPLARELGCGLAGRLRDSTVVASLQGWLRRWDSSGLVTPRAWDGHNLLPHIDAAVVSEEDFEADASVQRWAELAPVVIVTMGERGARLHLRDGWHEVRPFPARQVDPTGAGDVFAAAYLVRFHESGEPLESARFAACAAGLSVEDEGVDGIPTRAQVEERLREINT